MINSLLRLFEGILFHPTEIDEYQLASLLKQPQEKIVSLLKALHRRKVLVYDRDDGTPRITFLRERIKAKNLTIDRDWYAFRHNRRREGLQVMTQYLQARNCRQVQIGHYFGETDQTVCGECDICRSTRKRAGFDRHLYSDQILKQLEQGSLTIEQILAEIDPDLHDEVIQLLQYLVDEAYLVKKHEMLRLA